MADVKNVPSPALSALQPRYLVVAESRRPYLRRVDDLLKAIFCIIVLGLILLGAMYARSTSEAVAKDLSEVLANSQLSQLLQLPLNVLMNLYVLSAPLLMFGYLIYKNRWRDLPLSVVTALVGGLSAVAVTFVFFNVQYYLGLTEILRELSNASLVPIAPHLTSVAALIAFTGERQENKLIKWLWNLLFALSLLAVIQNRVTLPTAAVTITLGAAVGFLARFAFGVRNPRPDGISLALAVNRIGLEPQMVIRRDGETGPAKRALQPVVRCYTYELNDAGYIDPESLQVTALPEHLEGHLSASPDPQLHLAHARCFEVVDIQGKRYRAYTAEEDSRILIWLKDLWRNVQVREMSKSSSSSLRAAAEYRAMMSAMVAKSGINALPYYGLAAYEDTIANVYEQPFSVVSSAQLREGEIADETILRAWQQLLQAHRLGLTHRCIEFERARWHVNSETGRTDFYLVNWSNGQIGSSDFSRIMDCVQFLVLCALLVGQERALSIAERALGRKTLFYLLPYLQPLMLESRMRITVKKTQLINQLREAMLALGDAPRGAADGVSGAPAEGAASAFDEPLSAQLKQIENVELRRFSVQRLAFMALGLFALVAIVGSLNFQQLKQVLSNASPTWIALGALSALLISVGQTISLQAVCPRRLPTPTTYLVQTAGALTALVAPTGVGGAILNLRYLYKRGFDRALSLATVTLMQAIQVIVTFLSLGLFLALTGTDSISFSLPSYQQIMIAALIIVALAGLFAIAPIRNWLWSKIGPSLQQLWPRLLWIFSTPSRLIFTSLGALLQLAFQVACFYCALAAFGQQIGVDKLVVTFLISNTLGSLIPTPGGLGPVEAALTGGLQVAGLPTSTALATALLYRLLTFWMRAPIGWVALKFLQNKKVL